MSNVIPLTDTSERDLSLAKRNERFDHRVRLEHFHDPLCKVRPTYAATNSS